MKKVLIWDTVKIANTGGPAGYLFNILEYLKTNPTNSINFLSNILKQNDNPAQINRQSPNKFLFFICKLIPFFLKSKFPFTTIKNILDNILHIHYFVWKQFKEKTISLPDSTLLDDYDFIHFHLMTDLLKFKNTYPNYKGKTILTSHCPGLWTDEKLHYEKKWMKFFRPFIIHQECKSFTLADYLMFPCKEAREAYEKEKKLRKHFIFNEHKFFYIPTGLLNVENISESQSLRKKMNIPQDAFVISFFGRHTQVKGYDILSSIGEKILNKHSNLYFICAGNGEIKAPNHPRWIELGFINNVKQYLTMTDLYVLPNRETYFDLIVLELLRSGVPILLSRTGGNKYFLRYPQINRIGLKFFEINDQESLEREINNFILLKKENCPIYKSIKESNRQLFNNYFTIEKYIQSYLMKINQLES